MFTVKVHNTSALYAAHRDAQWRSTEKVHSEGKQWRLKLCPISMLSFRQKHSRKIKL